jgi:hypothetical protein
MTRTEKEILKVLIDLRVAKVGWIIRIYRTYAGRHQLAAGSWKWWADRFYEKVSCPWSELCGSSDSCTDIIKAHKSNIFYIGTDRHSGGLELTIERKRKQ